MMSHLDQNDLLMMAEKSGVIEAISPLGDFIEVNRESFEDDGEFGDWPTEIRQILNCPGATWLLLRRQNTIWLPLVPCVSTASRQRKRQF